MAASAASRIYDEHVRPLPLEDRLRLLALIADDIAEGASQTQGTAKRSILELSGLGQEIWEGVDAQEYVSELRREWDERAR